MAKRKRSGGSRTARPGNPAIGSEPREAAGARQLGDAPPPKRRGPDLVPLEGYLPRDGATYPQVLQTTNYKPTQVFFGVVGGLLLFLFIPATITQLVIAIGWWFTGRSTNLGSYAASALRYELPVGMLAANLGLAALVPISWFLITVVHRVRPRWLSSVTPGVRWPFLGICLGLAVVALIATQALGQLFSPPLAFSPQPGFWGFFVVIIISSPLQAVAEEVFFRGYLMQALGSLVTQPWFGVIASSLLFAALHGTQNLPLFLNRLAFGLLAGALVLRTGGLEAGIAAHVINNVVAYVLAGLTSSMAALKAVNQTGWAEAGFQVLGFAVFAALVYLVARKVGLRWTVDLSRTH